MDTANPTLCCSALLVLYGKKNMLLSCKCCCCLCPRNSYAGKSFTGGQLEPQLNAYKKGFASPLTRHKSSDFRG